MTTSAPTMLQPPGFPGAALYCQALALANRIPLSFVQLVTRVAVAHVFWASAQSKLASWPVTQQLFAMEYRLPVIPPEIAAPLATTTELVGSILIFFGLLTRLGALALLGVTATIQIFVYPQSWPDHIMWAAMLLLLLARGAGVVSLDHLVGRFLSRAA